MLLDPFISVTANPIHFFHVPPRFYRKNENKPSQLSSVSPTILRYLFMNLFRNSFTEASSFSDMPFTGEYIASFSNRIQETSNGSALFTKSRFRLIPHCAKKSHIIIKFCESPIASKSVNLKFPYYFFCWVSLSPRIYHVFAKCG